MVRTSSGLFVGTACKKSKSLRPRDELQRWLEARRDDAIARGDEIPRPAVVV